MNDEICVLNPSDQGDHVYGGKEAMKTDDHAIMPNDVVLNTDVDGLVDTNDFGVSSDISHESVFQETDEDVLSRLKEAEALNDELQSRLFAFEERFTELQTKMNEVLDSNGSLLSSIENNLHTRADEAELKQLKKDFAQFSKRLKRVVQAEDSINAESLDATKVPPDVLEITYAKTLNDIYNAMLGVYGDRDSAEMVEEARESVRQFSAGVDFFRFENDSFIIRGLSDAISSKIVSVKQIHGTYIELFKILFQHVPNYNSQDFRSFVETGSREYTIKKVVLHEHSIDKIVADISVFQNELSNITENVSFIAELQNNQLEDATSKSQELIDIREQMKSIAKAVNLHTRAINKLNKNLVEFRNSTLAENHVSEFTEAPDLSRIEEMVGSKASREDIIAISGEMESFKASVENMLASIQQQVQENILTSQQQQLQENVFNSRDIMETGYDLSVVQEEPYHLNVTEEQKPRRFSDIPIEDVITGQLLILGSATLKQLEKQINENGVSIDFEKLSLVMSYLEQEQLVSSTKKGRYTFYSVADPVNV
ncbi:hypothetical protein [Methanolobus psychrotolerans]|uniref:hypothetical protein n=1 Tax=Methanolobus psychrotolerans TaxID=1874706 RepID=UPI000B91C1EA|nr:hypothetical protein [Methanolobus psychrotolerans]